MALACCDEHRPELVDPETVGYALPLGYPHTALVCDVAGCQNPARLWLGKDERNAFLSGTRIFPLPSGTKIHVADDLFPN
jgi:hypothetical protein